MSKSVKKRGHAPKAKKVARGRASPGRSAKKAGMKKIAHARIIKKKPISPARKIAMKKHIKSTLKAGKAAKMDIRKAKARIAGKARKATKAAPAKAKTKITVKPPEPPKRKTLSAEMHTILAQQPIRQWLVELGGENTLSIIKNLPEIPNDEAIAKKLKIRISDVRASLNKLHNSGLVVYMRDKNNETGWYSYSWELNEEKIKRWVDEKEASQKSLVSKDGVDMYFCKDCGLESVVRFELAMDYSFKCPNCSSSLDRLDEAKLEQIRKSREER